MRGQPDADNRTGRLFLHRSDAGRSPELKAIPRVADIGVWQNAKRRPDGRGGCSASLRRWLSENVRRSGGSGRTRLGQHGRGCEGPMSVKSV